MQTIITKFIPATNTRGCRIKVTSWLGSKTYSYDYQATDVDGAHKSAFNEYLSNLNEQMKERHPACQEAIEGNWFKLVAYASLPDTSGYAFIIK